MMQRSNVEITAGWALLGAVLTVGVAAMITTARGQYVPGGAPGQTGVAAPIQPGSPAITGEPGLPGRTPFRRMSPTYFGGPPVVTANDRFVFVLRGNTLYKLDANDLKLLAQTELPGGQPMVDGGRPLREGDQPAVMPLRPGSRRPAPGAPGEATP